MVLVIRPASMRSNPSHLLGMPLPDYCGYILSETRMRCLFAEIVDRLYDKIIKADMTWNFQKFVIMRSFDLYLVIELLVMVIMNNFNYFILFTIFVIFI